MALYLRAGLADPEVYPGGVWRHGVLTSYKQTADLKVSGRKPGKRLLRKFSLMLCALTQNQEAEWITGLINSQRPCWLQVPGLPVGRPGLMCRVGALGQGVTHIWSGSNRTGSPMEKSQTGIFLK